MGIIQVLGKDIAQLIAAGEVVERPSSVIKELLENAVDAGATAISVDIKHGGVTYMRVSDNGSGITTEDVSTMFLRHATSKIHGEDDLNKITTLGFRGEALASIQAVSRVELTTKTPGALEGTLYVASGGEQPILETVGCPVGTTIVVRDLFFNTPARMKFLKKDVSEANSVEGVVEKTALSHPEISFKLTREGQVKLHTPGDGKLLSAIYALHGKEQAEGMINVDYREDEISITGYVTTPAASRTNRTMQNVFINGRYVKSKTVMAALEQAYKNSILTGKFPGCVLSLKMPYSEIDVNVHPAKIEVRFTNEKSIFDTVYYGVKNALHCYDTDISADNIILPQANKHQLNTMELMRQEETVQPRLKLSQSNKQVPQQQCMSVEDYKKLIEVAGKKSYEPTSAPFVKKKLQADLESNSVITNQETSKSLSFSDNDSIYTVKTDTPVVPLAKTEQASFQENETEQESDHRWDGARIIGEVLATYILLENQNELLLIDKHAAHERLIFNSLKEHIQTVDRQVLLESVVVSLSKEDYEGVLGKTEVFLQVGFLVEDFGGGDLLVREVPILLQNTPIKEIIEECAHSLALQKSDFTPAFIENLLHSVACKAAVRAGDSNSVLELKQLVKLLQENADVRYCPHGRPIAKSISKREIEKMFLRV